MKGTEVVGGERVGLKEKKEMDGTSAGGGDEVLILDAAEYAMGQGKSASEGTEWRRLLSRFSVIDV
ncbi:unnamed protein product [Dovyalis caffra]|uniref:Uncharacterized protein n=1 Tax=Dovyalis caffra TaxID=77055 RepID=A0AAV1S379_9ROSI|nr:unnamed protein product [Dovyalis caffra]